LGEEVLVYHDEDDKNDHPDADAARKKGAMEPFNCDAKKLTIGVI
jgi:hypothetical protein